jgi:hypothetical protein
MGGIIMLAGIGITGSFIFWTCRWIDKIRDFNDEELRNYIQKVIEGVRTKGKSL